MRIIGVDPSLTCTGVAGIGRPGAGADVWSWSLLTKSQGRRPTYEERAARIREASGLFVEVLDAFTDRYAAGPLLLVIESRDFQSPGKAGAATDRAGLSWQFVINACSWGARVAAVAPDTLKVYATGDGHADKRAVQTAIERRYNLSLRNDNEADAVTLAAMGAHAMGAPLADVPFRMARALTSVQWPRMI